MSELRQKVIALLEKRDRLSSRCLQDPMRKRGDMQGDGGTGLLAVVLNTQSSSKFSRGCSP